jgi:hypothetical protein
VLEPGQNHLQADQLSDDGEHHRPPGSPREPAVGAVPDAAELWL